MNVCVGEVFLSWDLRVFRFKRPRGYTFSLWDKDALIEFWLPCGWFQMYICLRLWAVRCSMLLCFKENEVVFTSATHIHTENQGWKSTLSWSQIKRMPCFLPLPISILQVWIPTLLCLKPVLVFILTFVFLCINSVGSRSQNDIDSLRRMVLKGSFLSSSGFGASAFEAGHNPVWQFED